MPKEIATTPPLRVLVVDDSPFSRDMIIAHLSADPGIVVAGEASDGREAVKQAARLKPDLITMDVEMPVMDGLNAIGEIMLRSPTPILVVTTRTDAPTAFEAISRGALEVMEKPGLDQAEGGELVRKVKLLARVKVITHLRKGLISDSPSSPPSYLPTPLPEPLVAVASSTGGPQALATILSRLPQNFPAPVVVAQHIAPGFTAGMAKWLDGLSPLTVKIAEHGEVLRAGTVYLAAPEHDVRVMPGRVVSLGPPEGAFYHPSCDILLGSAAAVCGAQTVGVILTGMGNDGVKGMRTIKEAGGTTIAQDEGSSVIFGMNRLAVESGAVARVLSLDDMAAELVRTTASSKGA